MMAVTRYVPWAVWAARNVQRHAGRSMLLLACLSSLVFLTATALLFSQALDATWAGLIDQAPDLVVRRIDAGGWAPLPVDEALACANNIPGVLNPTPRLWGVAAGSNGPLTVVTSTAAIPRNGLEGIKPPSSGQAVIGQGVIGATAGGRLELNSRESMILEVIAAFPADSGLATHDLVWLAAEDARRLLGLAPGQASDLAIHLFHREEEQAIQADLAAAFPWPVRITDRSTAARNRHMRAVRTGGIALVAAIPALLALVLIIAATAADSAGQRTHWGLLKAMGWTTADIVRLQTAQALIVGIPAVTLGLAAAYAAVFVPPVAGITAFWITGGQHLPALTLNGSGAILTMVEIAALAGLPYLATVFLTTLQGAANAPLHLLQVDPWS
jgi:hypothetical protein